MKYVVVCTVMYNGTIEVDANDGLEALDKAAENLNMENLIGFPDYVECGSDMVFAFGEATSDYAYKIE